MARLWVVVTVVAVMLAVSLQLTAAGQKKRLNEAREKKANVARGTFILKNLATADWKAEKRHPADKRGFKKLLALLKQKSAGRKRVVLPDALEKVFNSFSSCQPGPKTVCTMNEDQFSKLVRAFKLLSKGLTANDVHIIFNKAKTSKTDRNLDYDHFKVALQLMADKKYRGSPTGYKTLVNLIAKQ